MDTLHQRLLKSFDYLRDKGVLHTRVQFADAIGKSEAQISLAFKNTPKRCTKGLMDSIAAAFPDVLNPEYLKTGEGDVGLPDKNLKPHYPATVAAGVLSGDVPQVMDYEVDMEPPIRRFGQYDYMIDVEGSSMEPTYYTGDTLACRKLTDINELTSGKPYVFVTRDGAVIKRYVSHTLSTIRVSSDNPEFKPYSIDQESILSIAEVVGSLSYARQNKSVTSMLDEETILKLVRNIIDFNNKSKGRELSDEDIIKYVGQMRNKKL